MPDICKNKHCVYFDPSEDGTKKYLEALDDFETEEIERLLGKQESKHKVIEIVCPFLTKITSRGTRVKLGSL